MVTNRLWYCTVQTVLLGAVCSHVRARPDARQSFRYNWGAAGWGEKYMFMFDWSALMTPLKATLDTVHAACVHFCDSYPIESHT
jgi:hypothetical protein